MNKKTDMAKVNHELDKMLDSIELGDSENEGDFKMIDEKEVSTNIEGIEDENVNSSSLKDDNDNKITPNDEGWTDYVLGLLSKDELIEGNPTVDGLRRLAHFLIGDIVESLSEIIQTPNKNNDNRACVIHTIFFDNYCNRSFFKSYDGNSKMLGKKISGSADASPDNIPDKKYQKYLVSMAETRAESRALRRAVMLKKVVNSEEIMGEIDIDRGPINDMQINFIKQICLRTNINVSKFINSGTKKYKYINELSNQEAIEFNKSLSEFQRKTNKIPKSLIGYDDSWESNFLKNPK